MYKFTNTIILIHYRNKIQRNKDTADGVKGGGGSPGIRGDCREPTLWAKEKDPRLRKKPRAGRNVTETVNETTT